MFPFNSSYLKRIRAVRPDRLVSLWPQNEPLGHGISTEIIRGYHGAYTAVNLGQPGIQGSGLTSAGYDGAASFNNIYTAGFANDNGLANPGFETPGAGPPVFLNWPESVGDGAIASDAVIFHEGADSAKLTSGLTSNTRIDGDTVVVPREKRRFRFWTRGDGANAGRWYLFDVTNAALITGVASTGITAAAWGMVEAEYTVPDACVLVRHHFFCPAVNGGIAWFDATEDRRVDGFLGDKGTIIVPAQVANAGVWTDAATRYVFHISVDVDNFIRLYKPAAANTMSWDYEAANIRESQATAGLANLDFAFYGITWDISAGASGEVRYYIDGVASGAIDTALGTWVGDVSNVLMVIGGSNTVPSNVWSGNIGPVPVWSEALSPDEMRYFGT